MRTMQQQAIITIINKEDITSHYFNNSTQVAYYANGHMVALWDAAYTPADAREMDYYYEFSYPVTKGAAGTVDLNDIE